jgi:hypothetical protein
VTRTGDPHDETVIAMNPATASKTPKTVTATTSAIAGGAELAPVECSAAAPRIARTAAPSTATRASTREKDANLTGIARITESSGSATLPWTPPQLRGRWS